MTSPNTGLRRTALVVLAVGTALGASACSAGQTSQTASQVAAVDGGRGEAGELTVNDLQVIVDEENAEARVGFAVSLTGYGFDESVSIDSVEIDGMPVQLGATQPMERGCTIVFDAREDAEPGQAEGDICLERAVATLPGSEDLRMGTSVPATLSFSNGDQIETNAAVMGSIVEAGDYTRPADAAGTTEGN